MQIKIFKSNINEVNDTNAIEATVNNFIKGKKVIDIKQSIAPKIDGKTSGNLYFITMTVMYES